MMPFFICAVLTGLIMFGCTTPPRVAVTLGEPTQVADLSAGVEIYPWFPDGHISWLANGDGKYQMYWAGFSSYRSVGTSLEDMQLDPKQPVLTAGPAGAFDNGGAWLYSVFRLDGDRLIGFYHAEDHTFGDHLNPGKIAWKSLAVCRSDDNGRTWEKRGQFLTTHKTKPNKPTWGGVGDACVIYDAKNKRWLCFFQSHHLSVAESRHPEAAPGTWHKWDGRDFTQPGIGGRIKPLASLRTAAGGNPSVHFNEHLDRWFMVWHIWSGRLVFSTSADLLQWDKPATLLTPPRHGKHWYPTIIGISDVSAGRNAVLLYAQWLDKKDWKRQFISRPIAFDPSR